MGESCGEFMQPSNLTSVFMVVDERSTNNEKSNYNYHFISTCIIDGGRMR